MGGLADLDVGETHLQHLELAAEVHRQAEEETVVTAVGDGVDEDVGRLQRKHASLAHQRQGAENAIGRKEIAHFQGAVGACR